MLALLYIDQLQRYMQDSTYKAFQMYDVIETELLKYPPPPLKPTDANKATLGNKVKITKSF